MDDRPILTPGERSFVADARRAILATVSPSGAPRLVPVCFVVAPGGDRLGRPMLYSPIDEKPKASPDPRALSRVQDLLVLPDVSLLVDRWDEDWTRLAWVRLYGRGVLLEPQPHEREEHAMAVGLLRAKYAQYASHRLEERPIIRIVVDRSRSWGAVADGLPEAEHAVG
ncbi:MAG TPA: TIGR03668 family PPOX class F420-dependent oxidoreductase [Candidatus Limnocylindrales bacterium]|nr:TIGR03668 family PPOX class F420-dependent oxidoreductase [Candidatus Limnocylindrales bacterium]